MDDSESIVYGVLVAACLVVLVLAAAAVTGSVVSEAERVSLRLLGL